MGSSSVTLFFARPGAGTGAPPAMTVSQQVSDGKGGRHGEAGHEFGLVIGADACGMGLSLRWCGSMLFPS